MVFKPTDRVYSIYLDVMTGLGSGSGNATFYNTDSQTCYIVLYLTNGNTDIDMTKYSYILSTEKPDGTVYRDSYTTTETESLVIQLNSDMSSVIGTTKCQLYVIEDTKRTTIIPFTYKVSAGLYNELAPESENHDSFYTELKESIDHIIGEGGVLDTAKAYTDTKVNEGKKYTDSKVVTANNYTDGKLIEAKSYTDEKFKGVADILENMNKKELVTLSDASTVALTTAPYQYINITTNTRFTLPTVPNLTDIHLYCKMDNVKKLNFPSSVHWIDNPTINKRAFIEYILTALPSGWLGKFIPHTYNANIISNGLKFHYDAEDISGENWLDVDENTYWYSVMGGKSIEKYKGGFSLVQSNTTLTNTWIKIPTAPFTIEFYMSMNIIRPTKTINIFSHWNSDVELFRIYAEANNIKFAYKASPNSNSGVVINLCSTSYFADGNVHHLAMTIRPNGNVVNKVEIICYIDAVEVFRVSKLDYFVTANATGNGQYKIGEGNFDGITTADATGAIYSHRQYHNKALLPEEIVQNYFYETEKDRNMT